MEHLLWPSNQCGRLMEQVLGFPILYVKRQKIRMPSDLPKITVMKNVQKFPLNPEPFNSIANAF